MKKLISVLLLIALVISAISVCASAATFSVSSSANSVIVGQNLKITIKLSDAQALGNWKYRVSYDPAYLEYSSMAHSVTDGTMNCSGGGGALLLSGWTVDTDGTKNPTCTLTFKTRKIGSTTIGVASSEVNSFAGAALSAGSVSKKISIVAAPDLSGENNLSALSVSVGELNPAFASGTTAYTVTVPYETTSLSVYATAKDGKAKVSVASPDALAVGENTVTVAVTAEDGSEKTYTVTVTRAASELSGVMVEMDENTYEVAYDPITLAVPSGYTATTALYGEKKILVFSSPKETLQIAYLIRENEGAWYIYDGADQTFSEFRLVAGAINSIVLLTPSEEVTVPQGFLPCDLTVGEEIWNVYQMTDSEATGIYLVYGMNAEGDCGFYYYDAKLANFFSYFEPVEDTSAEDQALKEALAFKSLYEESKQKSDRMEIFFLIAAVLAALFMTAFIVALVAKKKKRAKDPAPEKTESDLDYDATIAAAAAVASPANEEEVPESASEPEVNDVPSATVEVPRKRRARRTLAEIGKPEEAPAPVIEPAQEVKKEVSFADDDVPTILR